MFRGREMLPQDIGKKLLDRMALELKTISTVERMPLLEGRNMIMILAPAGAAAPPAPASTPAAAPAQPPARAQAPKS